MTHAGIDVDAVVALRVRGEPQYLLRTIVQGSLRFGPLRDGTPGCHWKESETAPEPNRHAALEKIIIVFTADGGEFHFPDGWWRAASPS